MKTRKIPPCLGVAVTSLHVVLISTKTKRGFLTPTRSQPQLGLAVGADVDLAHPKRVFFHAHDAKSGGATTLQSSTRGAHNRRGTARTAHIRTCFDVAERGGCGNTSWPGQFDGQNAISACFFVVGKNAGGTERKLPALLGSPQKKNHFFRANARKTNKNKQKRKTTPQNKKTKT